MYVLAYLSSATSLPTEPELHALLATSRKNNQRDGITGLLLYHDGNFFQALEGPQDAVEACYKRIAADDRHHGHIVLMAEETDQRQFADWSMAFVPYDDLSADDRDGFQNLMSLRDSQSTDIPIEDTQVQIFVNAFLANFRH